MYPHLALAILVAGYETVENLWASLSGAVCQRHPTSQQALVQAIREQWPQVATPSRAQTLINSRPCIVRLLRRLRGGPIGY